MSTRLSDIPRGNPYGGIGSDEIDAVDVELGACRLPDREPPIKRGHA